MCIFSFHGYKNKPNHTGYVRSFTNGTNGNILPLAVIGATGSLKTPNGYWLPLATFLLVINNESRTSFANSFITKTNWSTSSYPVLLQNK